MYLMMMYLNGDGVVASPQKAQEIYEKASEAGPYELVEEIIKKRLANPNGTFERITCSDISLGTIDMNACESWKADAKDNENSKRIVNIGNQLNSQAKNELLEINKQFEVLKNYDGQRVYMEHIDGTIRGLARAGMESYLLDRHMKRIEDLLVNKNLIKINLEELKKADDELNKEYQAKLLEGKEMRDGSRHPELLDDYEPITRKAQNAWIKYRDAWVRILKIVKPKDMESESDIENSIKARLSKERIEELDEDPVSPGPGN